MLEPDSAGGLASKFRRTCNLYACGPRKERPRCGARNRQGKPCAVKVEPGKRRCRFHGGLSTGPKTAAGRCRPHKNLLRSRICSAPEAGG